MDERVYANEVGAALVTPGPVDQDCPHARGVGSRAVLPRRVPDVERPRGIDSVMREGSREDRPVRLGRAHLARQRHRLEPGREAQAVENPQDATVEVADDAKRAAEGPEGGQRRYHVGKDVPRGRVLEVPVRPSRSTRRIAPGANPARSPAPAKTSRTITPPHLALESGTAAAGAPGNAMGGAARKARGNSRSSAFGSGRHRSDRRRARTARPPRHAPGSACPRRRRKPRPPSPCPPPRTPDRLARGLRDPVTSAPASRAARPHPVPRGGRRWADRPRDAPRTSGQRRTRSRPHPRRRLVLRQPAPRRARRGAGDPGRRRASLRPAFSPGSSAWAAVAGWRGPGPRRAPGRRGGAGAHRSPACRARAATPTAAVRQPSSPQRSRPWRVRSSCWPIPSTRRDGPDSSGSRTSRVSAHPRSSSTEPRTRSARWLCSGTP